MAVNQVVHAGFAAFRIGEVKSTEEVEAQAEKASKKKEQKENNGDKSELESELVPPRRHSLSVTWIVLKISAPSIIKTMGATNRTPDEPAQPQPGT
jgi:hypothetical protein